MLVELNLMPLKRAVDVRLQSGPIRLGATTNLGAGPIEGPPRNWGCRDEGIFTPDLGPGVGRGMDFEVGANWRRG
jgi:hypothetical protein